MPNEGKIRISPTIRAYSDDEHKKLDIEIELPGVEKKDIDLKIHDDSFYLIASREDLVYVANYATCCPVDPEKAKEQHIKVDVK
jgi:HSP20 family molecular chaperone IbpA